MIDETSDDVSFKCRLNFASLTPTSSVDDFIIGIGSVSVWFENVHSESVEFSTLAFGSDVVVTDTILNAATEDLKVSVESMFNRFVFVTVVFGMVVVFAASDEADVVVAIKISGTIPDASGE